MIQIQLQPEIECQLAAEARARGVALAQYVEKIVSARFVDEAKQGTIAEAIDAIRELRRGNFLGDLNLKALIREGQKY